MATRTISISVSRTVQVERFEPSQVTVTETIEVKDVPSAVKEARSELYAAVTKQVASYIENEQKKYGKKKRKSEDDDE